jgi:flavin-dependent dehydrogenase
MKNAIIVGGGLAGLVASIRLVRNGIPTLLIEKKGYPFHRVCGEFISHEATPFLKAERLFPEQFSPPQLTRFQLSSVRGRSIILPLDLGGFGISRYTFDHFLFQEARSLGVEFLLNTEVDRIDKVAERFNVVAGINTYTADVVLCAYGKRSKLDLTMDRAFTRKRSPYVGVKYHIKTEIPDDLIALHNFSGGYCGLSRIEDGKANLCYLAQRDHLRKHGNIKELEQNVLYRNPFLKSVFNNSEFLFDKPEVINEVSFETKRPVEAGLLMIGDAAGMITPLCGNGMAIAIHSAKICSDWVIRFCRASISREAMQHSYETAWRKTFSGRLTFGRQVQRLFGSPTASNFAVSIALYSRTIARQIIRNTHGHPF